MNAPRAILSGSFDPLTNGHVDVIRQALTWCEELVVAVGVHASKAGLFDYDSRVRMIDASLRNERVRVTKFDDLVVEAARRENCTVIVRGVRDGTDLDYEMQMAAMNAEMAPDIRTVFLPASPRTRHITATLVRQIAKLGGDVKPFVPAPVAQALSELSR